MAAREALPSQLLDQSNRWCLFLDLDGTLIEFAAAPQLVKPPPELVPLLMRVAEAFDGALAMVSGRSLSELDQLLAPLRLPAAGLHGVERRDAEGRYSRCPVDTAAMDEARRALCALADCHPETVLEDKGLAVALHYRRNPAIGPSIVDEIHLIAKDLGPTLQMQEGAYVCEIKPSAANKRTAVETFLAEPPFLARRPIFVGDDLSDRDAFHAVTRRDGLAIAVGARTAASWRLPNPAAVRRWLAQIAHFAASLG